MTWHFTAGPKLREKVREMQRHAFEIQLAAEEFETIKVETGLFAVTAPSIASSAPDKGLRPLGAAPGRFFHHRGQGRWVNCSSFRRSSSAQPGTP